MSTREKMTTALMVLFAATQVTSTQVTMVNNNNNSTTAKEAIPDKQLEHAAVAVGHSPVSPSTSSCPDDDEQYTNGLRMCFLQAQTKWNITLVDILHHQMPNKPSKGRCQAVFESLRCAFAVICLKCHCDEVNEVAAENEERLSTWQRQQCHPYSLHFAPKGLYCGRCSTLHPKVKSKSHLLAIIGGVILLVVLTIGAVIFWMCRQTETKSKSTATGSASPKGKSKRPPPPPPAGAHSGLGPSTLANSKLYAGPGKKKSKLPKMKNISGQKKQASGIGKSKLAASKYRSGKNLVNHKASKLSKGGEAMLMESTAAMANGGGQSSTS